MDKYTILSALDRYITGIVTGLTDNDEIEQFRFDVFIKSKPVPSEAWYLIEPPYRCNQKSVEGFMKELYQLPGSAYGEYFIRIQELTLVYDDDGKLIVTGRSHLTSSQLKRFAFMYLIQQFFEQHTEMLEAIKEG